MVDCVNYATQKARAMSFSANKGEALVYGILGCTRRHTHNYFQDGSAENKLRYSKVTGRSHFIPTLIMNLLLIVSIGAILTSLLWSLYKLKTRVLGATIELVGESEIAAVQALMAYIASKTLKPLVWYSVIGVRDWVIE